MLSIQKSNFVSFTGNKSNKPNNKSQSNSNPPAKFTPEQAQAEINELKNKLKETKTSKIKNKIGNAIITIMIAGGIVSAPKVIGVFNDKNKAESKKDPTEIVIKKSSSGDSVAIAKKRSQDSIDAKNEQKKELEKETVNKKSEPVHKKTKHKIKESEEDANIDFNRAIEESVYDEDSGF